MFGLKIIAMIFAALFIIAILLASGTGTDILSQGAQKIGEWLKGSPLGGALGGNQSVKEVNVLLKPANLTIKPEAPLDMSAGSTSIVNFSGSIKADFYAGNVSIEPANSQLKISMPAQSIIMDNLRFSVSLTDTAFTIEPNLTATSGDIEIRGFSGTGTISQDGLRLQGNVTKLRTKIGNVSFELV